MLKCKKSEKMALKFLMVIEKHIYTYNILYYNILYKSIYTWVAKKSVN